MTGIYIVELVDVLRAAGCTVNENGTTAGWQKRARSSGGFPDQPLGVQWHHTASSTSPPNDLSWMINGSDDAPIGNVLLDRTGTYWPVAAGASNTAGKGGPLTLSRGTVPVDGANSRTFAIEAANAGTGEPWPIAQINAYFVGSNALNAHFGNRPTDVFTHHEWAQDRKIDPATASAVSGSWRPASVTSSGTWSLADIRNECSARAGHQPPPPPNGDDDVEKILVRDVTGYPWVTDFASYATAITEDQGARGRDERGWQTGPGNSPHQLDEQDTDLMHRLEKP